MALTKIFHDHRYKGKVEEENQYFSQYNMYVGLMKQGITDDIEKFAEQEKQQNESQKDKRKI